MRPRSSRRVFAKGQVAGVLTVELVAAWLAWQMLRVVIAALFFAMAFGWATAILFLCGKFRWVVKDSPRRGES